MKGRTVAFAVALALAGGNALAAQKAAAPAACDRACLLKLADDYLAALVAHDPSKVALAPDAKLVEQVAVIKPGEGLWKTTSSAPTAFRLVAADPVSQQVGGIVVLQVSGKPAQLGFRLKRVDGKIVEAEHLIAELRDPNSPNLQAVRPGLLLEVPYEYADSRGRMVHIAKSYYDALDNNNGDLAPFAPDCQRHENGFRTAPFGGPALGGSGIPGAVARPPGLTGMQDCTWQLHSGSFQYIATIENRRVDIVDPVTGLAIGFSHFRHPMTVKKFPIRGNPDRSESDMSTQKAFDMPALHLFKIWGGKIHEIEAVGWTAPFDSPTPFAR